jgi:hypothetical protein
MMRRQGTLGHNFVSAVYVFPLVMFVISTVVNTGLGLHGYILAGYASDMNVADIYMLSNDQRASAGSPKLTENAQLMAAAANKAADMLEKNYWAHNSPAGQTPWDFILASGYKYTAAAENLAKNFDTSSQVISAWMNSTEHRTNLLNSRYRDVGIAVVNGTLLGEQTTLVVMEFGEPAVPTTSLSAKPVVPVKPPTPTTPKKLASHKTSAMPTKEVTAKPVVSVATPAPHTVNPNPLSSWAALKATFVTVTWPQWSVLALTCFAIALNYLRQALVWRANKRMSWHVRWLRAHPMFEINMATCAGALMLSSAAGVMK